MVKWGVIIGITGLMYNAPYYLERQQLKELLSTQDSKLLWHQWFWTVGLTNHPKFSSSNYPYNKTLHELAPRKGKGVRVVFIDTGVAALDIPGVPYHVDLSAQAKHQHMKNNLIGHNGYPCAGCHPSRIAYMAGHGTHSMGIVAAQGDAIIGFAPEATCSMIKAFSDDGTTTLATFIKALERAVELKADILNLSLKIDASFIDSRSRARIEELLTKIPYVVAAAGNNNQGQLCYPACLAGVDFVVTAFDYNHLNGTCSIPGFCKAPLLGAHEPVRRSLGEGGGAGTLSLPGLDVLSTGLAPGRMDGVYVVQDGTSVAAACMTGFLSLLLGELGVEVDKQRVMTIIQKNRVRLDQIVTIDMRQALRMTKNISYGKI